MDFLNLSGHNDIITHTDKQNLLTPLDLFCILFILQIKKKYSNIQATLVLTFPRKG